MNCTISTHDVGTRPCPRQVDPTFTYAYTLAAHEYFANADYDKATTAYRAALKLDPRHYNAL